MTFVIARYMLESYFCDGIVLFCTRHSNFESLKCAFIRAEVKIPIDLVGTAIARQA